LQKGATILLNFPKTNSYADDPSGDEINSCIAKHAYISATYKIPLHVVSRSHPPVEEGILCILAIDNHVNVLL